MDSETRNQDINLRRFIREAVSPIPTSQDRRTRCQRRPRKQIPIRKTMNEVQFWDIIDRLQDVGYDDSVGTSDERRHFQIRELRCILSGLQASEVVCFEEHFVNLMIRATTEDVVAAASIVLEGISYDSFDYFVSWLILQGQVAFYKVIQDPDSLIDAINIGGFPQFEEIRAIPRSVHASKTKNGFSPTYDAKKLTAARKHAFSTSWSNSDLKEKFSRICNIYLEE
jgi:hypothetical protein